MVKVGQNVLITGGAGFIGSNLASYFLKKGHNVIVFDNLSRAGSEKNLAWLKNQKGSLKVVIADIRNFEALKKAVAKTDAVFHLAAQTAVTTSLTHPKEDFEINAKGTLNVLEAVRGQKRKIPVIFSSTNKVYGALPNLKVVKNSTRYEFSKPNLGVSEDQALDFYSPYGCSKGVADQYVRDYARIYGLPTVVFRQSCVYGPRQFGVEDQGWVAHFVISAILKRPVTVFGDGLQVRDLLYIDDLVEAFEKAFANIKQISGKVYNIGGGIKNTVSIWEEFSQILGKINGELPKVTYKQARPGDQKIYISDITSAKRDFGWKPKVSVQEGIEKLYSWAKENVELFKNEKEG